MGRMGEFTTVQLSVNFVKHCGYRKKVIIIIKKIK
jgi:hypothetical protein